MGRQDATGTEGADSALDATARAMLALEARPFKYAGAKQEAIRSTLHMSSAQYHQRLNALIDTEAAYAYAPLVVGRLRRDRDGRSDVAARTQPRHEDTHR